MSSKPTTQEPTAFQLSAARAVMARYRAELLALDESYADDEQLLVDTIDGETPCIEILDAAVVAVGDLEGNIAGIDFQIARLNARKARFTHRHDRLRAAILETAQALGVPSLKRALYTLTVNKPRTSVEITAVDDLPQGYFKTVRQADKVAIKTSLDAEQAVPGAKLTTGVPSLTLRLK